MCHCIPSPAKTLTTQAGVYLSCPVGTHPHGAAPLLARTTGRNCRFEQQHAPSRGAESRLDECFVGYSHITRRATQARILHTPHPHDRPADARPAAKLNRPLLAGRLRHDGLAISAGVLCPPSCRDGYLYLTSPAPRRRRDSGNPAVAKWPGAVPNSHARASLFFTPSFPVRSQLCYLTGLLNVIPHTRRPEGP